MGSGFHFLRAALKGNGKLMTRLWMCHLKVQAGSIHDEHRRANEFNERNIRRTGRVPGENQQKKPSQVCSPIEMFVNKSSESLTALNKRLYGQALAQVPPTKFQYSSSCSLLGAGEGSTLNGGRWLVGRIYSHDTSFGELPPYCATYTKHRQKEADYCSGFTCQK